jgi:hypothetical protein
MILDHYLLDLCVLFWKLLFRKHHLLVFDFDWEPEFDYLIEI